MYGGTVLGMGIGYCINRRYIGFTSNMQEKIAFKKYFIFFTRVLLGLSGFLLIFLGIEKILPHESNNINLYRFMQTALAGFWVSAAAPWAFIKLHLAKTELN